MTSSIKGVRTVSGRKSCTYVEAIVLLHRRSMDDPAAPTPLTMASVVAIIYGRETLSVFEDIKRGMVP